MTTFKELGLNSEIMKSLDELGFTEPTPIQEKSIPFILETKKDLIALAQTGTGKTAAFGLPILNQIKANKKDLQAIILCPTRELCIQISQDLKKFAKHSIGISITPVYGGENITLQIGALKRGTNIVVGTPGRVCDLIRRKVLKLQSIEWLVLDEADEMLDMGFKEDLDAILEQTPKTRQTLLFSATISKNVHSIAKRYMNDAEEISIGEKNVGAENVSHEYYVVQTKDRFDALKRILDSLPGVYGILFCRTRRETQEISDKLKRANYDTEALHGDISQNMRTKIMDRFKQKQIRLLVATDVAARGIDVNNLTHVINYNLPDQNEAYTHRSGRTGRAQNNGVSVSLVSPREVRIIRELEHVVGRKIEQKKIPCGEEIFQKQIERFIEDVEKTDIKKIGSEKYFSEIADKLKKLSKEDLIKYFIADKFSHLMNEHQNSRDLNAQAAPFSQRRTGAENVNLKINFGKRHGFDIKGLFALVNSNQNLQSIEIGRINLMQEYSIFSVAKEHADEMMEGLHQTNYRGSRVSVSRSNESPSFSRNRMGGQSGGFGGSRGGYRGSGKRYFKK
ncbi:MAG: DEAD/DEAH box helicase [bacterium]